MNNTQQIETPAAADRPTFTILSDGNEVAQTVQILTVTIERIVNKVSEATLIIHDGTPDSQDFPASNGEEFLPGKEIEIQAGYHSDEESIFKGIVISQRVRTFEKKPSVLEVCCKDPAVKMTVGRKNKYFYESADAEVMEEIISAAGLSPDIEATDTTHQEMVQFQASDWDFIVSRADAVGAFVYTENGNLKVAKPDFSQNPDLTLAYGGNILDFEAEMDSRCQYAAVNAYAWDAANQEFLTLEAEDPSGEFPGNYSAEDLAGVIGIGSYDLRHGGLIKDTELQAQANAKLMRSRLAKVRARARIQGLGKVMPGQMVALEGVGDRFSGDHFVAGVFHEISPKNWETQIQLGLDPEWFAMATEDFHTAPANQMLPAVNGLQIGLVTALEADPEGEDRVQVRIPLIDPEEEGVWARVACLDAGENRGSFFRPELGDEVILGFMDDDPRNPVILGMLNSSAKPAPIIAADDNHEKGIITRSEMKLLFNDDTVVFSVETPNGNIISLSEEEGGIKLEDENGNKILMDGDGITIESASDITMKASGDIKLEGTNVELTASANFKGEGSAGAEVSSSGTAVLKGSMVQIN
ncbi:MAG: type VI secretion system tip protein VgrG [Bacteroidota bacterium]